MLLEIRKNQARCRGVSFIELLVSMIVLALSIAGMVNLFDASKRWIEHSQYRMTAGEITRRILDPLQRQVQQDQWGVNCLSTGTCPPDVINLQGRNYNVVYTIDNDQPIPNVNRVRIDINWNEPAF